MDALLARLGPGECFREMGLSRREPAAASVATDADTDLDQVSGQDLRVLGESRPAIAWVLRDWASGV